MKLISFLMFVMLASFAMADNKEFHFEKNGIQITMNPFCVTSITVDGNPFSEKSELYVMKPAWAGAYYTFGNDTHLFDGFTTTTETDGTMIATLKIKDRSTSVVVGSQQVKLTPNREVIISCNAKNTSTCQAIIEHNTCDITPSWFAGRVIEIAKDGKIVKKHLPFSMTTNSRDACRIGKGFSTATLKSRLGDIVFSISGNTPITLLDYRMAPFLEGKSQIWLGVLSYDFAPDDELHWSVGIQFPDKKSFDGTPTEKVSAPATKNDLVFKPASPKDIIIPTPKEIEWGIGNVSISNEDVIFIDSLDTEPVAQYLRDEIERDTKLKTSIISNNNSNPKIKMVLLPNSKEMSPESYSIKVDKYALLEAQTTTGLLNASRTFLQLLRYSSESDKWSIRRVYVNDWPIMSIRAVEFYTGKDSGQIQSKIVSDLMGRFKMNMLIHHINYAEWKSRPDLLCEELVMRKNELKMVFDECLRQNIEYVPFFPAYGLLEWLRFKTNHPKSQNLKASVWNDPDEMSAIASIFTECIEEFHPRYLHIAHDELYDASSEDLIASIKYWHNWLKARNIKTMIWSDLFLAKGAATDACNAPSEEIAAARRKMLPKDIIITDWHYAPTNTDYKSLSIFNNDGFDTIASSWCDPNNIFKFGKSAAKETSGSSTYKQYNDDGTTRGSTLGQLATTWAGWNFNKKAMDENTRQLANYILTAESSWVGGYNDPSEVPFDILSVFFEHWQNGYKLPGEQTYGWTVDLNSVANLSLKPGKGKEWLGFPPDDNISEFPTGKQWFNNSIFFNIPKDKCVLFNGVLGENVTGLDKLVTQVNKKADTIIFALAATTPYLIDLPIAETIIRYEDNSTEKIAWRVAYNIFSIDDMRVGATSPILYKGKTKGNDKPFSVHSYIWSNPSPTKSIKEIVTTSKNRTSSMLLFGITGLEGK